MNPFRTAGTASAALCALLAAGCQTQISHNDPPRAADTIFQAAQAGNVVKINALLRTDPQLVNARENGGWTPLHWAAFMGKREIAEILLARGAEINVKENDGLTPLHEAAYSGRTEVVELLLARGADVNAKDKNGWTPLHLTVLGTQGDTCKVVADLLRQHGGTE